MNITLTRKDKPSWKFKWDDNFSGYVYKSSKRNIYRIFFDNCNQKPNYDWATPDIWIGKLIKNRDGNYVWITIEKQIKAESILFFRAQYNFN